MPVELRDLVFSEQFIRIIQQNGINIDSVNYYADEATQYLGHQVIARRPFRNRDSIIVFSPDGRRLFTAYAGYLQDAKDARANSKRRREAGKAQKVILESYLEKPLKRKSLLDELPEARKVVGCKDIVNISKKKKSEVVSDFFKGV